MRRELAALGRNPCLGDRTLDAAAQRGKRAGRVLDTDPERVRRAARRKLADTLERQLEGRVRHSRQRLANLVKGPLVHLADEAQGEMKLLGVGPADTREALAQPVQGRADFLRRRERDEQAGHAHLPDGAPQAGAALPKNGRPHT